MEIIGWLAYIFAIIINGCIWGAVTYGINQSKGYYNNGFWWGFWLGLIGVIVVLCQPNMNQYQYRKSPYDNGQNGRLPAVTSPQPVPAGGWQCSCGRAHPAYVSSCGCGKNKNDILSPSVDSKSQNSSEETDSLIHNEETNIKIIKQYKELLDSGAITQEEFEAKKKQLLGS